MNRYPFLYCFKLHGIYYPKAINAQQSRTVLLKKQFFYFVFASENIELYHEKDKQQMVRKNCMTIVYKVKILQHL